MLTILWFWSKYKLKSTSPEPQVAQTMEDVTDIKECMGKFKWSQMDRGVTKDQSHFLQQLIPPHLDSNC